MDADQTQVYVSFNFTGSPRHIINVSDYGIYAKGNAITAASGSRDDIQAAVDSASDGDTVIIPSGTFDFGSGYVEIRDKAIHIKGAGRTQTIIEKTSTEYDDRIMFQVFMPYEKGIIFSDMKLKDNNGPYEEYNENNETKGIALRCGCWDFKIYNMEFEGFGEAGILTSGSNNEQYSFKQRGVIYNCRFLNCYMPRLGYGVSVHGADDRSWLEPIELGTAYNVFVEDCYFEGQRHHIASGRGSRYVFRYNHCKKNKGSHGVDAHGWPYVSLTIRGSVSYEIYENIIEDPWHVEHPDAGVGIRGGTGVIYNNIIKDMDCAIVLAVDGCAEYYPCDYPVQDQINNLYIWNNTYQNCSEEIRIPSPYYDDLIQENRDYFLFEKAGYTPYPYPHPLRTVNDPDNPIASFSAYPTEGIPPLEVSFDASASYDPDGNITSYEWDFGDGNSGSGITTTHTYQESGVFTAKLAVTDNDEQSASDTQEIKVGTPPVALFEASPMSGNSPLKVEFDASYSYDPDGNITSYEWDFGDGNTGSGITTTHTYQNEGTYTAKLTVTDNDDHSASDSQEITVRGTGGTLPVASFVVSPTEGAPPLDVSFDASASYDPDGNITSYEWDFGDGNNGSGITTIHTYQTSGVFTAKLTVTDNDDQSASSSQEITVTGTGGTLPAASFVASPTGGTPPLEVSFDASASYDPDGNITSYEWDFGDGNTGSGITTIHTYQNEGTYTAKLTVTDNDEQSASSSQEITVTGTGGTLPVALFEAFPMSGNSPLEVEFDASYSFDNNGEIVSYYWDFGDGTQGNGKKVTHTYYIYGNHTAILKVTDNDAFSNSTSKRINVVIDRPYPPLNVEITRVVNREHSFYDCFYKIEWSKDPKNKGKYYIVKYRIYRKIRTANDNAYALIKEVNNQTFGYEDKSFEYVKDLNLYTYALSSVDDKNRESALEKPTIIQ